MLSTKQVELLGVTQKDIQEIFEKTIKEYRSRFVFLDASYLYTFHTDDFPYVKKLTLLTRYDSSLAIHWHRLLERWYQDQTVRDDNGVIIKPIKVSRTLDRIVNTGMELVAGSMTGQDGAVFDFREIGDGDVDFASPADTRLSHSVDSIDVNKTAEGGSLSRDGITIYSIGNHSADIETPANEEFTECGMFDSDSSTKKMLDHSIFEDPIPHVQFADAPGSTTVIYMCSA